MVTLIIVVIDIALFLACVLTYNQNMEDVW